jgi:hypothetical protein
MAFAKSANVIRPYKLDLYIFNIDGILGFQPSFALGRMVVRNTTMALVLGLVYDLLPVAIVLVFGGYLRYRSLAEAMRMIPVFVWNLALSVFSYVLVPVCGPAYAFPNFPNLPTGPIFTHPIAINAPPNGVPSIHFSTALLIFWYARKLPFGRWIGGAFLFLTGVVTMASGEHYLFDLAVALPYAAFVYGLSHVKLPKLFVAGSKTFTPNRSWLRSSN